MPNMAEGKQKGQSKKNRMSKLYNQQVYQLLRGGDSPDTRGGPDMPDSSSLPPSTRARLHKIFGLIEKEFETVYLENVSLQEKLDTLTERLDRESIGTVNDRNIEEVDGFASFRSNSSSASKVFSSSGRLKSHTNKLKYQTTKIMSGLKAGPAVSVNPVKRYPGHKDGVWEVAVSRMGLPILGTVSADQTAKIWGMHSGSCLLQYQGHTGSVNSIRFHPSKELVLTTSGDGTAHIWQCAVNMHNESSSGRVASSEDELDPTEREFLDGHDYEDSYQCSVLRTPLKSLQSHSGVVISGDWLPGGDQVLTAGWDRLASIWDADTGELIQQLGGHDEELTHCATHPTQRLVVTSSKDSTFRLWDFRETIHSVSVFQGHQDTVTSAVFVPNTDLIVSGSDDRSAKVWDLRNMRTAMATIQSDSAVNRISVSSSGLIAVPYDNRNVRIFDLTGNRLARLPRSSHQGHSRMVCSTAWANEGTQRPNLFTCGFDRQVIGWAVEPRDQQEEKEGFRLNLSLRGKDMAALKEHLYKDKEGKT